jgi:hypothetical protein
MRRRLGAALLALAVLAACGDGDRDASVTATSVPGADPATSLAEPGTTTTTGATAGGGAPPVSGGTAGGGAGVTTTPPSPGAALAPGGVGGLAGPLLRAGNGNRIVVEVRAQAGAEPRSATLQELLGMLREVSGKTVVADGIDALPGTGQSWTSGSLVRAADGAAEHPQGGAQVTLRLLFVHGTFEGDESVLGVAVRGDVAAVFTDQIDRSSGLLTSPAVVEHAVTIHEVGHLLGLVDLAIDTGRDDPEHPGHSTNDESVMYWAVESDLVGQVLGAGIPTDFDAQDRADLSRIRSG